MFYCEPCGTKNGWPTDFYLPMSRGPCECCDKVAGCFDVPSRLLSDRSPQEIADIADETDISPGGYRPTSPKEP